MSILFTHFLIFSARFLLVHKNKAFIKDFFSKCDQIRRSWRFLQIWSHLLKTSLMESFVFCPVYRVKFKPIVEISLVTFGDQTKTEILLILC